MLGSIKMNPAVVDTFLETLGLENLLNVDRETIIDFAISRRSYDPDKFDKIIDESPDWASVIAAHIHLDHILDAFLEEFCVIPSAISPDKNRMSALDKATFLYGVGVLSEGSMSNIRYQNKMRNRFAHRLEFAVSGRQVAEYRSAMMSSYGDRIRSRDEHKEAVDGTLDIKLLIKFSVIFVEEDRIVHMILGLERAQDDAKLRQQIELANERLGRTLSNLPS